MMIHLQIREEKRQKKYEAERGSYLEHIQIIYIIYICMKIFWLIFFP